MKFHPLLTALVVLTVVLAGCASSPVGDDGDVTTTAPSDDGPGDQSGSVDGGTWSAFEFDTTGKYVFDVYVEGEGTGTLVWDVQEVSGDTVTAGISYDLGDSSFQSTVTGDRETVRQQLLTTPAGSLLVTTMLTPGVWFQGRELAVGNGWSYQTSQGSGSFEVTGRDSVGGVSCYTTEMVVDGTTIHEGCVSPDHGLAPHSAYYDEDGTRQMEVTLRSYGPTDGPSDAGGQQSTTSGGETPGTSVGDVDSNTLRAFSFDHPATYTYDVYVEGEGRGTMVWDVQQVSGDTVTVHVEYDVGDTTYASTVSGDADSVRSQLVATPAGVLLYTTMFTPMAWYGGKELTVGNSWSYSDESGSMSFAVTGTSTYAGLTCYDATVTVDGETQHEGCLSAAQGMALYSAYYDDDGSLQMEIRLTDYEE